MFLFLFVLLNLRESKKIIPAYNRLKIFTILLANSRDFFLVRWSFGRCFVKKGTRVFKSGWPHFSHLLTAESLTSSRHATFFI